MAVTDQQQTSIFQLIQAMFNATPGAIYLQTLREQMEAGQSVVDLAQSLSGNDLFFGRNYPADLTPGQFAVVFVNDLVGNRAPFDIIVQATSYIINQMAAGATQTELIAELTQALSAITASDPNWGEAALHYNTGIVTKVVENLVGDSVTADDKASAVNDMLTQMAAGQTFGSVVEWAIAALDNVDHADSTWGNAAALFDNRIAVSKYYSVDKVGSATHLIPLRGLLAEVTADGASVATVKAKIDDFLKGTIPLLSLNGSNGFRLDGVAKHDSSGESVSSAAGDVNGDGFADVIVGAMYADSNGNVDAGSSYVIFGKAAGFDATLTLSSLNGLNGFRLDGVATNDYSGVSVSSAGDVNGDGFDDVMMSLPYASPNGNDSGSSYVIFGGNFTAAVTHPGTPENDNLIGTSAAERFVAGNGNDTMTGSGGADVFHGGAGDDIIQVSDLDFRLVDGGTGSDTLTLVDSGMSLNLLNVRSKISDIETIDLTGTGNNTLTLTPLDVLNLSNSSNTLKVDGNAGDHVVGLSSR